MTETAASSKLCSPEKDKGSWKELAAQGDLVGHDQAKIAVGIQAQALVVWVAAVKDMALKAEALKGNAASSVGGHVVHQAV